MRNNLRMSDILARGVQIEWFEAVAVVRGVIDRLQDRFVSSVIPELEQIELTSDGQIALTGAVTTDEPVRRLGQVLHAILGQGEPPVQLRLLITQATAAPPVFASIQEFSTALDYFERPNREKVLASLFLRAAAAPLPTTDAQTGAPFQAVNYGEPVARRFWKTPRQRALWLVGGAALLVLVGTAVYVWSGGSKVREVTTFARNASGAISSAIAAKVSSAPTQAGQTPADSAVPATTTTVAASSTAVVPKPAAPRRTERRKPSVALDPVRVPEVAATPLTPPALREMPVTGSSSTPVVPERPVRADQTVYSQGSEGVIAPVGLGSQLPRDLPPTVDRSKLVRIELVVLPDGTVQSAKLLNDPYNIHESMFLSAAKAWKFKPAIKNGRPVAYRKIITIGFSRR
jgi:hypothetical protein